MRICPTRDCKRRHWEKDLAYITLLYESGFDATFSHIMLDHHSVAQEEPLPWKPRPWLPPGRLWETPLHGFCYKMMMHGILWYFHEWTNPWWPTAEWITISLEATYLVLLRLPWFFTICCLKPPKSNPYCRKDRIHIYWQVSNVIARAVNCIRQWWNLAALQSSCCLKGATASARPSRLHKDPNHQILPFGLLTWERIGNKPTTRWFLSLEEPATHQNYKNLVNLFHSARKK